MEKSVSETFATVRLIPSTVTEPFVTIYFSVVKRAKSFVLAAYLVHVRQIKHPLYSSASIE